MRSLLLPLVLTACAVGAGATTVQRCAEASTKLRLGGLITKGFAALKRQGFERRAGGAWFAQGTTGAFTGSASGFSFNKDTAYTGIVFENPDHDADDSRVLQVVSIFEANFAVVSLVCPPTDSVAYYGLAAYINTRNTPHGNFSTPLVEVSDPINSVTINTTADGTLALVVMTADRKIYDTVVDAFEAAGLDRSAANLYPIPSSLVNFYNQSSPSSFGHVDSLLFAGRATQWASDDARATYESLVFPALLMTAPAHATGDMLPIAPVRDAATGVFEQDSLLAAYDALIAAVRAAVEGAGQGYVLQSQDAFAVDRLNQTQKDKCLAGGYQPIYPYTTGFDSCDLLTTDSIYAGLLFTPPPFGSDSLYVAVGVDHKQLKHANYTSLMLTGRDALYEQDNHTVVINTLQARGSAEVFLDTAAVPEASDLWTFGFGRECPALFEGFCYAYTEDQFPADAVPFWAERAYLQPATATAPDPPEYMAITLLTFTR